MLEIVCLGGKVNANTRQSRNRDVLGSLVWPAPIYAPIMCLVLHFSRVDVGDYDGVAHPFRILKSCFQVETVIPMLVFGKVEKCRHTRSKVKTPTI